MTFDLFYAVLIVIVDDLWLIPRQMTPPQKDVPQYPAHAYRLAITSKQQENRPPTTERMLTPDFIMVTVKTFKDLQDQTMALLKGLKWTIKSMGPKWVVKEIIRRIAGIPYTYNGILVKDDATFRVIRNLASKGSVWRQGDTVFFPQ